MYFLLDLCCKVSRADARPQAPCTAAVSPADAKVTPAPQQQHRATPSILDATPQTLSSASSVRAGPSSNQLPNAAASAGDPSPKKDHTGLHTNSAAAGDVQKGSDTSSMTSEAAVLGAMAAAAAAGLAAGSAASLLGETAAATGAAAVAAGAAATAAATTSPSGETAAATGAAAEAAAEAEANSLDKVQAALSHKPCRACTTAQDMLAAFRTSQFSHSSSSSRGKSSQAVSEQPAGSAGSSESSSSSIGATGNGTHFTAETPVHMLHSSQQQQQQQQQRQQKPQKKQPFWFYEDEMPCPPDILELGRATWTLLHSVAAYYPDQPTEQQQHKMRAFVDALGEFYPCEECRGHLVKELQKHPPEVGSSRQLSHWACRLHNLVNIRLGKPSFDCDKVLERWRDGPADDADACGVGH